MARMSTIRTSININEEIPMDPNASIQLVFEDGRVITVQLGDLAPSTQAMAIMHGLKQKLVDAAAISRDPETGRSATTEDKYRAVKAIADRLSNGGPWNAARGEGGGTGAGGLLFAALMRLYPSKGADALREYLGGLTPGQQAALRKNPRVAPVIEEIKAERAANGDDGDEPGADLLAGLEAM